MQNASRRVVVEGRAYDENGNLILHPPGGTPVTQEQVDNIGGGGGGDTAALQAQVDTNTAAIAALDARVAALETPVTREGLRE